MKPRVGVYPGSFDPFHLGHFDLVERAAGLVDEVVVGILENTSKSCIFGVEERVKLVSACCVDMPVQVVTFGGLLVDFARDRGAAVVFRGLRAVSDFDYEFQMALMNRRLAEDVETVFLMASQDHTHLSSRLVKEVAMLGGDVAGLVPAPVATALAAQFSGG